MSATLILCFLIRWRLFTRGNSSGWAGVKHHKTCQADDLLLKEFAPHSNGMEKYLTSGVKIRCNTYDDIFIDYDKA